MLEPSNTKKMKRQRPKENHLESSKFIGNLAGKKSVPPDENNVIECSVEEAFIQSQVTTTPTTMMGPRKEVYKKKLLYRLSLRTGISLICFTSLIILVVSNIKLKGSQNDFSFHLHSEYMSFSVNHHRRSLLTSFKNTTISQQSSVQNITAKGTQDIIHPDITDSVTDEFRILYIMASSSKSDIKKGSIKGAKKNHNLQQQYNRWKDLVVPILQNNIESYYQPENKIRTLQYHVDVYLITSYQLNETEITHLRQVLPTSVGLQLWLNAEPFNYNCLEFPNEPSGIGVNCQFHNTSDRYRGKMIYGMNETRLRISRAQLARQHRYVVKDKLPYYDFIVLIEDDMVVTKTHVEQHIKVMKQIRQIQYQNKSRVEKNGIDKSSSNITNNAAVRYDPSWNQNLSPEFLERMRPGFIRVEVLDKDQKGTREDITSKRTNFDQSQIISDDKSNTSGVASVDPMSCCDMPDHINASAISNLHPSYNDLVIWETNLIGFRLRPWMPLKQDDIDSNFNYNRSWIASTLSGTKGFPAYWTGRMLEPKPRRPVNGDPRLIAQSAGWMGSSREIMEYQSDLCMIEIDKQTDLLLMPKYDRKQSIRQTQKRKRYGKSGSFLPPFDPPSYIRDGLWRHNVEYYSGGVQLWNHHCQVQRVLSLEDSNDFSRHLIYHASNNKQHRIDQERLIRANTLWKELNFIKTQLELSYHKHSKA